MIDHWCVLLNTGNEVIPYGPMDRYTAEKFAAFLTAEVDPATPRQMRSPTREMLGYWASQRSSDHVLHPDASGVQDKYCTQCGAELANGHDTCPATVQREETPL